MKLTLKIFLILKPDTIRCTACDGSGRMPHEAGLPCTYCKDKGYRVLYFEVKKL